MLHLDPVSSCTGIHAFFHEFCGNGVVQRSLSASSSDHAGHRNDGQTEGRVGSIRTALRYQAEV